MSLHPPAPFASLRPSLVQVAPEPKSSITGKQSDGLGGYDAAGYTIGESEGKIGGSLIVEEKA